MTLSYKKAVLKFEKANDIDIKSIGSIIETKEPCAVQHSPVKFQQAQDQPGRGKPLPTFKRGIFLQLNVCKSITITDIAVTTDNKVFFCNFFTGAHTIYVYNINQHNLTYSITLSLPSEPYSISILTGTDMVVVTLPYESYVQFIDILVLTIDKSIEVGKGCYGITTSKDFLTVRKKGAIKILKQNGEIIKTIVLSDNMFCDMYSLFYSHHDGSIIYRKSGQVYHIQLDGTVKYQYTVSGEAGIAVDAQSNVYMSDCNKSKIQRLLPDGRFRDVVLTEKDGIAKPYAIAFNNSFTKFVVANNTGLVQIYNCK